MTDFLRQAHAALRCLCAVSLLLGNVSVAAMAQTQPPAETAPAASPAPSMPAQAAPPAPAANASGTGLPSTRDPDSSIAEASSEPAAVAGTASLLPRDLSPFGMFLSADIVVKAVIIGLAFASIVTWTVWLAKTIELAIVKRRLRAELRKLAAVRSSTEGLTQLASSRGVVAEFLGAAVKELQLSADAMEKDGIKERIGSRLERIEAAHARRATRSTGVLATIGATAPFVGLFGTVWGIMNSFINISKSHTTNLAVVAPGIAEALLATAFGLAAAIPAVVIYNMFSRSIAGYRALLGDASAEVLRLVSRDLDRQTGTPASRIKSPSLSAAE
jgi:biopolymer transport protein ExbB